MIRRPVWNPVAILQALFRGRPIDREGARLATRWRRAFDADPELRADLIRLGRVLAMTPPAPGTEAAAVLNYEAGQRDLALQLLSLGGVGPYEINRLMTEENDNA